MKSVNIKDLDVDDLYKLIDEGERFYVVLNESDVLPEHTPSHGRDTFWFEEAPVAAKPIRLTSNEQKDSR